VVLQLASGAICTDHLGCCGGYFGLVELLSFAFDAYITSVSAMATLKDRSMGKYVSQMDDHIADTLYFILLSTLKHFLALRRLHIFKMG